MPRPRGSDKVLITLRLPPETNTVLQHMATKNRRSRAAETLFRLEESLRQELNGDGRRLRYRTPTPEPTESSD